MNNKIKQQAGFTLVELMVVIAVIAILASIGVPKMSQFIKKAKVSEVSQQAKWVMDAMKEYESSHELTPIQAAANLNKDAATIDASIQPPATKGTLVKVVPTLGIIGDAKFKYSIKFGVADGDILAFCMKALALDPSKTGMGAILYSSTATKSTDIEWENHLNASQFMNSSTTALIGDAVGAGFCLNNIPPDI